MNPKRESFYRGLFLTASVYDIVLGIIFTFFFKAAFGVLGIAHKLPEFSAYISLIGAFLFVIGIAYWLIYRGDLIKNHDLILVGALYKVAYSAIAFFYYFVGDIPHILFVSLFGVADLVFLTLMVNCYLYIGKLKK
ncbi:MAG: hypothetical protein ISS10_02435 [Candidatus Marinimicrobia bacterium]|nr:hypothetical protein [Candidatus Neomarinimicrobiota bacterium]MBL7059837.1 hypothetical protein [Candidatus Neomarinimicrobiota bacterium]